MIIKLSNGFINMDNITRCVYRGGYDGQGYYDIVLNNGETERVSHPDDIKKIRSILNHRAYCDLSRLSNEANAWRKINNKEHDE